MNSAKQAHHIWVITLLSRSLLFAVFVVSLCLLLYALGNYQDFLDSSQYILLRTARITSLLFLFILPFFLASLIMERMMNGRFRLQGLILSLLGGALVTAVYLITQFVIVFSGPS